MGAGWVAGGGVGGGAGEGVGDGSWCWSCSLYSEDQMCQCLESQSQIQSLKAI